MAEIGIDIKKAANLLESGCLVAIPTETVYGLAANALDSTAVLQIFSVKNRPAFDPLIVHISRKEDVILYAQNVPDVFYALASELSPGPVTYVLNRNPKSIPDIVSSGLPTVGIRFPDHPLTQELLNQLDFPLAAPSANPFGYISPTRAEHVDRQLGDQIPYILDGGACKLGIESTIIDLSSPKVRILRKGGLEMDKLVSILGYLPEVLESSSSKPLAPGNISSHYAPGKAILTGDIIENYTSEKDKKTLGILTFGQKEELFPEAAKVLSLSAKRSTQEAALHFFHYLRLMDENPDVEKILVNWFPEEGLGAALNDRLQRASAPRLDDLHE